MGIKSFFKPNSTFIPTKVLFFFKNELYLRPLIKKNKSK